jgi:hypothetical protein
MQRTIHSLVLWWLEESKGIVDDVDTWFEVWKVGLTEMGSNGTDDLKLNSLLALAGLSISVTGGHSQIGLMPKKSRTGVVVKINAIE